MEPLVTILVPVYNGAEFLRATLDSLLKQSDPRFEVLCLDDGSTDHSAEIIRNIPDPRIRLLQHPNRGLCETINRGISETKTPFVARNDQDDLSVPHRLEKQLAYALEHPDVDCAFSHYQKTGRSRMWQNLDKQTPSPGNAATFRGLPDGCQLASTMFARTEVLRAVGGFRQSYYPADDWDLQLRLVERFQVRILLEPLVIYRFHLGANTYRLFALMQLKGRWAEDSHRRRTQGLPEQSFEQFSHLDRGTRSHRLRRALREFAALQLRMAGQHLLDGQNLRAYARGLLSFASNPAEILHRFRRIKAHRNG